VPSYYADVRLKMRKNLTYQAAKNGIQVTAILKTFILWNFGFCKYFFVLFELSVCATHQADRQTDGRTGNTRNAAY